MSHFQMDCQGGSWGKKPRHQSTADQQMQAEILHSAARQILFLPDCTGTFFSLFFKQNHEQKELPRGPHLQCVLEARASCLLTASQKDERADSC